MNACTNDTVGHTATHAVVVARLFIKGQDHGPHNFIVQLRSLEDHTPLSGMSTYDNFFYPN